jgi:NodT family efflux transporter outer membrane factor (OMF) lipoprotein
MVALILSGTLAAGCVGPDYHRPPADIPAAWRMADWHEGVPGDAVLKGDWWILFHDAQLNDLVQRALANNQNLRIAVTRVQQARAQVTIAASAYYPQLDLDAAAARAKTSADRPLSNYAVPNVSTVQNDFRLNPVVSYEADLFGGTRRSVEAARAAAGQAEADLENARLVLVAQLLSDYFTLRELDAEIDVVRQSTDLQRHALDVITARHELGFATGLDLAEQQALLASTAAQIELLQNERAQNEHAIATLVAEPAPDFTLPPAIGSFEVPALPVGLPSDVLQRRPDVASAERAMAAANARIGVARAAYFPSIQLMPLIGWESNLFGTLLNAPSRLWSVGASAGQTVFDAGKARAGVRSATAGYMAAVAGYRQTVLTAMEEVQNGITGLAALSRAGALAASGVQSAQRAYDIANERYTGGVATFLDVFTAQETLLTDQRQAVQIRGQELLTAVYLIKALGGGWEGVPGRDAGRGRLMSPEG